MFWAVYFAVAIPKLHPKVNELVQKSRFLFNIEIYEYAKVAYSYLFEAQGLLFWRNLWSYTLQFLEKFLLLINVFFHSFKSYLRRRGRCPLFMKAYSYLGGALASKPRRIKHPLTCPCYYVRVRFQTFAKFTLFWQGVLIVSSKNFNWLSMI